MNKIKKNCLLNICEKTFENPASTFSSLFNIYRGVVMQSGSGCFNLQLYGSLLYVLLFVGME